MGNVELCPRRKRLVRPCPEQAGHAGGLGDAVCTVSPRNRLHVWDMPGKVEQFTCSMMLQCSMI